MEAKKRGRGGQPGAAKLERPQSFWYGLCSRYDELVNITAEKISHAAFLRSDQSGPDIDFSKPNCAIFGKKYRLFKEGKLVDTDKKRVRSGNAMAALQFARNAVVTGVYRRNCTIE
jgi:hypothetical protein